MLILWPRRAIWTVFLKQTKNGALKFHSISLDRTVALFYEPFLVTWRKPTRHLFFFEDFLCLSLYVHQQKIVTWSRLAFDPPMSNENVKSSFGPRTFSAGRFFATMAIDSRGIPCATWAKDAPAGRIKRSPAMEKRISQHQDDDVSRWWGAQPILSHSAAPRQLYGRLSGGSLGVGGLVRPSQRLAGH